MPEPGLYYGIDSVFDSRYRRFWPIESPGNHPQRSKPRVVPGDIVHWNKTDRTHWSEAEMRKTTGLVLMVRWCLADWIYNPNKKTELMPEALVLWNDGETTNTSHECLVKLDEKERSQ